MHRIPWFHVAGKTRTTSFAIWNVLSRYTQSQWQLCFYEGITQETTTQHLTKHYIDITNVMASQITSLTIVYSTIYSGVDQRKHQRSASLAFVPVTGEFPAQKACNAENISIWWTQNFSICFKQDGSLIVRRAGLLWSQQDFEWRWSVPLFKCLTVLEFSFILFDLCLLITFFNFIMNYVPIVTFWIFTYHKIWILSIMFCFIWSYWIIYFLACLEVSWRVVS